ncbi:hypothetical protein Pelo_10575 [Pelomyxa schiedti]|nr:hypothetical protein Pelo_10575 [Pelomyxa schiedti]
MRGGGAAGAQHGVMGGGGGGGGCGGAAASWPLLSRTPGRPLLQQEARKESYLWDREGDDEKMTRSDHSGALQTFISHHQYPFAVQSFFLSITSEAISQRRFFSPVRQKNSSMAMRECRDGNDGR